MDGPRGAALAWGTDLVAADPASPPAVGLSSCERTDPGGARGPTSSYDDSGVWMGSVGLWMDLLAMGFLFFI